jgi:hypothetical protein
LNGEANRVRKKQSSAIIAVDVRRFGHAINTDEVFGTHKWLDFRSWPFSDLPRGPLSRRFRGLSGHQPASCATPFNEYTP